MGRAFQKKTSPPPPAHLVLFYEFPLFTDHLVYFRFSLPFEPITLFWVLGVFLGWAARFYYRMGGGCGSLFRPPFWVNYYGLVSPSAWVQ